MKFRVPILLVAALVVCGLAQPPGVRADNAPDVLTVPKGQPIKIGWAGDQSLQVVKASTGTLDATRMAVKDQNDAGGIQGFKLLVVPKDDQCVPATAELVARQFVAQGDIAGIVGHLCSGAHIAASAVYETAGIVSVSPTASSPHVTDHGLLYTNSIAIKDSLRSPVDADYLYNSLHARNLFLVDDGETYGQGLVEALVTDFTAWGGSIAGTATLKRDATDSQIAAVMDAFKSADTQEKVDAVYCGCYIEVAATVSKALSANKYSLPEYGTDAINIKDFQKLIGPSNSIVTYASSPIPKSDEQAITAFKDAFTRQFGTTAYQDYGPFQPQAYDAARLLIDAMQRTAQVDSAGNLLIDRQQLARAVRSTRALHGLTGDMTCTDVGECPTGQFGIFQLPLADASGRAWKLVTAYDPFRVPTAPKQPSVTPAATPTATQPGTAGD